MPIFMFPSSPIPARICLSVEMRLLSSISISISISISSSSSNTSSRSNMQIFWWEKLDWRWKG